MISRKRRAVSSDAPTVIMCPGCGKEIVAGDRFCLVCGTLIPSAVEADLLADLQAATVGEYDIVGSLGHGGMGVVFLAHEIALNRKVAIKVLLPSLLQGRSTVERFRREAQTAASLRNRHITSIFGFRETPQVLYFVMEYIKGLTLDSVIAEQAPLPIGLAVALFLDVADALDYAHRQGVVHRDIKPSNIIVDTDGMAVVTDFGIAKVSGATGLTSTGSAVGSPRYMSPEQWGGSATALSDQYALGTVAYEMIAGRGPFGGETLEELMKQQILDPPPHVSTFRPECPERLAGTVMRMLEKEPKLRWPTLDAAVAHLGMQPVPLKHPSRRRLGESAKRAVQLRQLPTTPGSPIPFVERARSLTPSQKRRRRRTLRWLAWGAGGVAVIGAAALGASRFLTKSPPPPAVVSASQSAVAASPASITADGEASTITVTARDENDNPISGATVVLAVGETGITLTQPSGPTNASGLATGTLSSTDAGDKVVSATVDGVTVGQTATVRVTAGAVSASQSTVRASPTSMRIGVTSTITVTARDGNGNPIANAAVVLAATGRGNALTQPSGPTDASGLATGTLSATDGGDKMVSATIDGVAVAQTATVRVTEPRPPPPPQPAVLQLRVNVWAYLAIDGVSRGRVSMLRVDTLRAGRHRLQFARPGYVPLDTVITLRGGERRQLNIELVPERP